MVLWYKGSSQREEDKRRVEAAFISGQVWWVFMPFFSNILKVQSGHLWEYNDKDARHAGMDNAQYQ